jgi:hypothetical protein
VAEAGDKDRNEVAALVREQAETARPFEELGPQWLAGVETGRIGRRRRRGQPYSKTTIPDYRRSYMSVLEPEFGPMIADEIGVIEWQMWVDRLSSEGLSRSRIASYVAVASAIYVWALTPSRRFVSRNPLRLVELPPNDEKPRLRVAFAPEAAQLLDVLEPADQAPYALAFYAGLRRAEIDRLEWPELLDGDGALAGRVLVARAKSAAGTERRPPIAAPLQTRCRSRGSARAAHPMPRRRALGHIGARSRRARRRPGRTRACRGSRCTNAGTATRRCSWPPATRSRS